MVLMSTNPPFVYSPNLKEMPIFAISCIKTLETRSIDSLLQEDPLARNPRAFDYAQDRRLCLSSPPWSGNPSPHDGFASDDATRRRGSGRQQKQAGPSFLVPFLWLFLHSVNESVNTYKESKAKGFREGFQLVDEGLT